MDHSKIADAKVKDYLGDIIKGLLWELKGVNPEDKLAELRALAKAKCTYDDPTIAEGDYQAIQSEINKALEDFFDSVQGKVESEMEYF